MFKIGRSRRTLLLLLPLLMGFAFQATQYARAPADYNYYVVYAKNADIALRPGNDLSPNGLTLLQNTTTQEGLYELTLGKWGPGYRINYTDAFRVTNREVFNIRMIGFNFTAASTGKDYLRIRVQNDTDSNGVWNATAGDKWVTVWDGSSTTLNTNKYIFIKAASSYGSNGAVACVAIDLVIPSTGLGLTNTTPELTYNGQLLLWFTSASF